MDKTLLKVFPYHQTPEKNIFPIIPLRLKFGSRIIDGAALIDSGAVTSIFRLEVATELGIKIEKGKEVYLTGIGGRIKGYLHKIKIDVGGRKFWCPIIFSHEYTVSLNLLGREGFFPNFTIIFDEKKKKVELK